MRKLTIFALLTVLLLVLAACGGSGGTSNSADEAPDTPAEATAEPGGGDDTSGTDAGEATAITLEAGNELKYNPAEITAPVGSVEIGLNNTGALEHNIVWEDQDPEVFVLTAPGTQAANTRTFDAAGVYNFYCTIPGHKEAGMVGNLTVGE